MNADGVDEACKSNEVLGSLLPKNLVAKGLVIHELSASYPGITVGNDR